MTQLIIECPFPPIALMPNVKAHWRKAAPLKKKLRMDAYIATKAILKGAAFVLGDRTHLDVVLTFEPTPKRQYADEDNWMAAAKSLIDGVADGLGVNDKIFRPRPERGNTHKQGRVIVTIG